MRHVETLLIVTEPYYRALETLGRITPLARELGIPRILAVANKVRSERDRAAIYEYSNTLGLELAGAIPYDDAVQAADQENRALIDYQPAAPATLAIAGIVDALASGVVITPTGAR